jgi:micrococcal nuclease
MNNFQYKYNAKCISVYDGDTITIDIDLGFHIIMKNQKIRLYGINTPEIRGDEREEGLKSKEYLSNIILGKDIILQSIKDKSGKYGRILGIIWYNNENINQKLLDNNYATKYLF